TMKIIQEQQGELTERTAKIDQQQRELDNMMDIHNKEKIEFDRCRAEMEEERKTIESTVKEKLDTDREELEKLTDRLHKERQEIENCKHVMMKDKDELENLRNDIQRQREELDQCKVNIQIEKDEIEKKVSEVEEKTNNMENMMQESIKGKERLKEQAQFLQSFFLFYTLLH